jgi:hypothetical protein
MTIYSHGIVGIVLLAFLSVIPCILLSACGQEASSTNDLRQLQLEVTELKQKISQLELKPEANGITNFGYELLKQGLALIGIAGGAGLTAFLAWRHERMIPPTVEQERILNEIVTKWYSRSHLGSYDKEWEKIEKLKPEDQQRQVEEVWDKLCVKKFPQDLFDSDKVEQDITDYLKNRLHIKETSDLKNRIDVISDASSVEYYGIVQEHLPGIAEIAVLATIGEKDVTEQGYEKVVEESLRKLKRLMVFYCLREDKKVVETIVRSAVSKRILEMK